MNAHRRSAVWRGLAVNFFGLGVTALVLVTSKDYFNISLAGFAGFLGLLCLIGGWEAARLARRNGDINIPLTTNDKFFLCVLAVIGLPGIVFFAEGSGAAGVGQNGAISGNVFDDYHYWHQRDLDDDRRREQIEHYLLTGDPNSP